MSRAVKRIHGIEILHGNQLNAHLDLMIIYLVLFFRLLYAYDSICSFFMCKIYVSVFDRVNLYGINFCSVTLF